jgi:hypothetical protein
MATTRLSQPTFKCRVDESVCESYTTEPLCYAVQEMKKFTMVIISRMGNVTRKKVFEEGLATLIRPKEVSSAPP